MTHPDRATSPGRQPWRQGRLFAPLGMHKGDPAKLQPENWLKGSIPGQHVAWHASDEQSLPARDDPHQSPSLKMDYGEFDDEDGLYPATDMQDRPMAQFGSAVGLHLGTLKSALDRGKSAQDRSWIHPAALPVNEMQFKPGSKDSEFSHYDKRGEMVFKDEAPKPWTDYSANYDDRATDLVEEGKVVPYLNEMEDAGSVSYRALPETARTWGETVLEAHEQHNPFADRWGRSSNSDWGNAKQGLPRPSSGQVAAAKAGYNPVVPLARNQFLNNQRPPEQQSVFGAEVYDNKAQKYVGHHVDEAAAIGQVRGVQTAENAAYDAAPTLPPGRREWLAREGTPAPEPYGHHLQVETPNRYRMQPAEERTAALSQIQFMKTGHRE